MCVCVCVCGGGGGGDLIVVKRVDLPSNTISGISPSGLHTQCLHNTLSQEWVPDYD